jgi:hypothetical protein
MADDLFLAPKVAGADHPFSTMTHDQIIAALLCDPSNRISVTDSSLLRKQ